MRNHPLVRAVTGENDSIRSRTASGVDLVAAQDGEFVIRTRVGEIEAFVIVVDVWIFVFTDGGGPCMVVAPLLDGVVDVGLIVTGAAALIDALSLREDQKIKNQFEYWRRRTTERGFAIAEEPMARIRRD